MRNKSIALRASKGAAQKTAAKAMAPLEYAEGVTSLINAWRDYKTTHEVETTRRVQIAANRDVQLAAIHEQAHALRTLIDKTFSERATNFSHFFDLLDQGVQRGDDRQINAALSMIVEQTRVNPMAQALQIMSDINNPDTKVIEI